MRYRVSLFAFSLLSISLTPLACQAENLASQIERGSYVYEDRCAQCHGVHGETKAMGRGELLMQMSRADIETKLKRYQLFTTPKGMKEKMKAGLPTEQIEAISAFLAERNQD